MTVTRQWVENFKSLQSRSECERGSRCSVSADAGVVSWCVIMTSWRWLALLAALHVCACARDALYHNQFAIHVPGGANHVDDIARRHGYRNHGQVSRPTSCVMFWSKRSLLFIIVTFFLCVSFYYIYKQRKYLLSNILWLHVPTSKLSAFYGNMEREVIKIFSRNCL